MSRRYVLALWLGLICVSLFSQQLYWENYRLPNTLSADQVHQLYESSDGLIWLGTSSGLSSFDGNSFTTLPSHHDQPAAALSIFEDQEGTIWVGYDNGTIARLSQGKLVPWEPEEGHPAAAITGITEDDTGRIWLATYGEGAYVVDGRHLYNFNTDDGLLGNDIYDMAVQADGSIWLGTDGGISICKFLAGKKSVQNLTRKDGLPDEIVRILLPDNRGNCWIGTHDKGVAYYDHASGTFRPPVEDWPYGPVNGLVLVEGRELFIATEEHGGWSLDLASDSLTTLSSVTENLLEGAKIKDILLDAEGGLWLLSNQKGLFRTNQQIAFLEAEGKEVQAVHISSGGKLWAGTDHGLFSLSSTGSLLPYPPVGDLNIVSLFEDHFGNLWLGTFGDGAYILHPATGQFRHLGEAEGLSNGSILSIDGQGESIWLASLGGVTEVRLAEDPLKNTPLNFKKIAGLKTDFIYQVLAETATRVWFATDGEGLALMEGNTITHLTEAQTVLGDSVNLRRVYSLTKSQDGHIWFNTAREGLFELTQDSLYARSPGQMIPGESITGMAATRHHQVVVSHNQGLALLNSSSGYYQEISDFVSQELNLRPILNAVAAGPDGQVWFGCSDGLIRYQSPPYPVYGRPKVLLQSVSVYPGNQPEPEGKRFGYDQNTLAFDFVGLWYTAPDKLRCRYQLEGYEADWIETKNQRVIYSKLNPGNYTFKVAATAGATWNDADVKTYHFSIARPVWARWWFLLLSVVLAFLLARYFIRRRSDQLRREALLQKQRIESKYEALKSQINPHFLFNSFNTLVAMIEESPATAVTYTEKLSDLFRSVLQYRDYETILLQEELDLLDNYLYLLDKRFGDKLKVTIRVTEKSGYIVPLSLQLLVENAIKHNVVSASRPLQITIVQPADGESICVQNPRQPKLRKEPSTGFGLHSLSERYALLTPDGIRIEETAEAFRVYIPILPHPTSKKT